MSAYMLRDVDVTLMGSHALQRMAPVIQYLVLISLLTLLFCMGLCAASDLSPTCS